MNKPQFVEVAPNYYMLAICCYFFEGDNRQVSPGDLVDSLSSGWSRMMSRDVSRLFSTPSLFWEALRRLEVIGLVSRVDDDFAPTMLVRSPEFTSKLQALENDSSSIFHKFSALGHSEEWLCAALDRIEIDASTLQIGEADFSQADQEWVPIPLDREEPTLQAAIEAIDDVVERIRSDNGYTASCPEERHYVLDALTVFSKTMKEAASIVMPYIETYAAQPLSRVAKRFGEAAIGIAVEVAKARLRDWLMKVGIPWTW